MWKQCAELAEARADQAEALCGGTSDSGPTGDEIDPVYYTSGSEDGHVDFGGPCESPCVCDSGQHDTKESSIAIIIPVVIAAVLLVAAVLYLVRKRRVAARQPHRQSSMPTIGGDDEAEVEA